MVRSRVPRMMRLASNSAAAARMARAVAEDSGAVLPVCAWVDGQYGISGVYLGVEAEIGRTGVRRIVERDLTESELAQLEAPYVPHAVVGHQ